MSISRYKLVFFCPRPFTHKILDQLFQKYPETIGRIGDYEHCAFVSPGIGQFKPGPSATPTIGSAGQLEHVDEDRVEVLVNVNEGNQQLRDTIKELKSVHPYEEVAYDVYRVEDF